MTMSLRGHGRTDEAEVAGDEEVLDSNGCEWAPLPDDDDFIPQIPWSRD